MHLRIRTICLFNKCFVKFIMEMVITKEVWNILKWPYHKKIHYNPNIVRHFDMINQDV